MDENGMIISPSNSHPIFILSSNSDPIFILSSHNQCSHGSFFIPRLNLILYLYNTTLTQFFYSNGCSWKRILSNMTHSALRDSSQNGPEFCCSNSHHINMEPYILTFVGLFYCCLFAHWGQCFDVFDVIFWPNMS